MSNRQMPTAGKTMPAVPNHNEAAESEKDTTPLADSSVKPPETEKKTEAPLKKGVEVIATQPGFYRNHRKSVGDVFTIPDVKFAGTWMKCLVPALEHERVKLMKAKKEKAKAGN